MSIVIEPLGEAAFVVRGLEQAPHRWAAVLNGLAIPGLVEAVASYETLGLYVDPDVFREEALSWDPALVLAEGETTRRHDIPVRYQRGPDLDDAAHALGISPSDLIAAHTGAVYQCFAIGFCPGFPYLGYLPNALSGLPRRGSPRPRIAPGTVAITGRQTGIYPLERPGGWWLIGQTPLCLVDVADDYFPISAGDEVRFHPIDEDEFERRQGERL